MGSGEKTSSSILLEIYISSSTGEIIEESVSRDMLRLGRTLSRGFRVLGAVLGSVEGPGSARISDPEEAIIPLLSGPLKREVF